MSKKILAMILAIVMVCALVVPAMAADEVTTTSAPVAPKFEDAVGSWAESSINRWGAAGILQGDEKGLVNPDKDMTRGEMATVLVRLLGLTEKSANIFADLTGKEWYADAVLKCAAAGIMKGDGTNCLGGSSISREETMVMFARAMGVQEEESSSSLKQFGDGAKVSSWAAGYVSALVERGIVSGVGNGENVAPEKNINRASTMTLLDKAIELYITEGGEYEATNAKGFVIVNVAPAEEGEEPAKVVLTGETCGVVVTNGTSDADVTAKDLTAETVKVDGEAGIALEGETKVDSVEINAEASVEIGEGVAVETVTANEAAEIKNEGTVGTVVANKDGVVVDGNAPEKVETAEGVEAPKDSEGNSLAEEETKEEDKKEENSSSSSSGGSSYTPAPVILPDYVTNVSEAKLGDNRTGKGTSVADEDLYSAYVVRAAEGTEGDGYKVVNVTVIAKHLMKHQNANGAVQAWVGANIDLPEGYKLTAYGTGADAAAAVTDLGNHTVSGTDSDEGIAFYVYKAAAKKVIAMQFTEAEPAEGAEADVLKVAYVLNTDAVEEAPDYEDLTIALIKDKASYNANLSAEYLKAHPWGEGSGCAAGATDAEIAAGIGLPWLKVNYTANVVGQVKIAVTKDGVTPVTWTNETDADYITASDKIGSFGFTVHLADESASAHGKAGKTYATGGTGFGSYAASIVGTELVSNTVLNKENASDVYLKVRFLNSVTDKELKVVPSIKSGTALSAVTESDWSAGNTTAAIWSKDATVYTDKACKTEAGAKVESEVDGEIINLYVKFAPVVDATLSIRPNGNISGMTDGSFNYQAAYAAFGITGGAASTKFSFGVDEKTILASKAEVSENGDVKAQQDALVQEIGGAQYLMLGVSAEVPAGTAKASLDGTNWSAVPAENNGGLSFYTDKAGKHYGIYYLTYYKYSTTDEMADKTVEKTVYYRDASDHIIQVQKWSMTRTTTPAEYTITYNLNGGTNAADAKAKYTYGTAYTLPTPTKTGYDFAGWFTDEELTKAASITAATTGNVTVYAKWTAVNYNVTVKDNNIAGCSATADKTAANMGDEITVTIVPRTGVIYTVSATAGKDAVAGTHDKEGGTFKFTMPASSVTVTVIFTVYAKVYSENSSSMTAAVGGMSDTGYTVIIRGTATSGVPASAKAGLFYNAEGSVKSQEELTTAIGKHTAMVIRIPELGEATDTFTVLETSRVLGAYVNDPNVAASGSTFVKTSEETGATIGGGMAILVGALEKDGTFTAGDEIYNVVIKDSKGATVYTIHVMAGDSFEITDTAPSA